MEHFPQICHKIQAYSSSLSYSTVHTLSLSLSGDVGLHILLQFYNLCLSVCMQTRHEQEKKREYNQRVLEIESAVFTPSVFSTSMGRESTVFYKRLADSLSSRKLKARQAILSDYGMAEMLLQFCPASLCYSMHQGLQILQTLPQLCRNPISLLPHRRAEWHQTRTNHPFFLFSIYHSFLVHITSLVFEPV